VENTKKYNWPVGLVWVVVMFVAAGLALPFVNIHKQFTPEQLMVFRGFIAAACLYAWAKIPLLWGKKEDRIGEIDKYAYLIFALLPFATLGLFQGIRYWGAGPTIVVVAATPLVNLVYSVFTGRRISFLSVVGFILMLFGVWVTCKGGNFNWQGFGWSVFGTLVNGVLMELFARSKTTAVGKSLFGCLGMGFLGLVLSCLPYAPALPTLELVTNARILVQLVLFAIVGGWLYWIASVKAMENLPPVEGSALLQLEALSVIIGAIFLLDEPVGPTKWFGAFVVLAGAVVITLALSQKPKIIWRIEVLGADGKFHRIDSCRADSEEGAWYLARWNLGLVCPNVGHIGHYPAANILCPDGTKYPFDADVHKPLAS
jgi:drug/metabolite transporter (DMT)-like permease